MSEGFVSKHPGQNGVHNNGVFATFHLRGRKKDCCTLSYLLHLFMQTLYSGEVPRAAQAQPGLLDFITLPSYSCQPQGEVRLALLYIAALGIGKNYSSSDIAVINPCGLNLVSA